MGDLDSDRYGGNDDCWHHVQRLAVRQGTGRALHRPFRRFHGIHDLDYAVIPPERPADCNLSSGWKGSFHPFSLRNSPPLCKSSGFMLLVLGVLHVLLIHFHMFWFPKPGSVVHHPLTVSSCSCESST